MGVPVLEPLRVESVKQHLKTGAVIVDIRNTHDFLTNHIEGSYGIPLAAPLITWAGCVIPFGTPIVLVADSPAEREEATRQLVRIGYDKLYGYLEGGVEAWQDSGLTLKSTKLVNAAQLRDWLSQKDAPSVLDVRFVREWQEGHIRGAVHVEAGNLTGASRDFLEHDQPLVVHCQHGNRSTVAVSILEQGGFKNLYALEDGFSAWVEARNEVTIGNG